MNFNHDYFSILPWAETSFRERNFSILSASIRGVRVLLISIWMNKSN